DTNDFCFYVNVRGTDGKNYYLEYHPYEPGLSKWFDGYDTWYAIYGIGTQYCDGYWHTIQRDLNTDLLNAYGTYPRYVRWFCLRGDYWVDDIAVSSVPFGYNIEWWDLAITDGLTPTGTRMYGVTVRTNDAIGDHYTNENIVLRDNLNYTVTSGSYLEYDIRANQDSPLRGSVQLEFTDGTGDAKFSWGSMLNDQNNLLGQWPTVLPYVNQWYHRVIPLSNFAGRVIKKVFFMTNDSPDITTGAATHTYYCDDIKIDGIPIGTPSEDTQIAKGTGGYVDLWTKTVKNFEGAVNPTEGNNLDAILVCTKPVTGDHWALTTLKDNVNIPIPTWTTIRPYYLIYDIRAGQTSNMRGSIQLQFTDGTVSSNYWRTTKDQNGRLAEWNTNLNSVYFNQWYHREIPLTVFKGKTIKQIFFMANDEPGISQRETDIYYCDNVRITRGILPVALAKSELATAYNNSRKLALSKDGTLHLVYTDRDSVFYTYSKDKGQNWASSERIGEGGFPALALDSQGHRFIALF
ncbi:MAG: hypothetical protein AB1393_10275, partial [Candidatus Edwardsbacteria bacterium]